MTEIDLVKISNSCFCRTSDCSWWLSWLCLCLKFSTRTLARVLLGQWGCQCYYTHFPDLPGRTASTVRRGCSRAGSFYIVASGFSVLDSSSIPHSSSIPTFISTLLCHYQNSRFLNFGNLGIRNHGMLNVRMTVSWSFANVSRVLWDVRVLKSKKKVEFEILIFSILRWSFFRICEKSEMIRFAWGEFIHRKCILSDKKLKNLNFGPNTLLETRGNFWGAKQTFFCSISKKKVLIVSASATGFSLVKANELQIRTPGRPGRSAQGCKDGLSWQ